MHNVRRDFASFKPFIAPQSPKSQLTPIGPATAAMAGGREIFLLPLPRENSRALAPMLHIGFVVPTVTVESGDRYGFTPVSIARTSLLALAGHGRYT